MDPGFGHHGSKGHAAHQFDGERCAVVADIAGLRQVKVAVFNVESSGNAVMLCDTQASFGTVDA
jgi:hypothetical protein